MTERSLPSKSADAYRTISEAAEELKLPQHVLRFWETRFPQVKPMKRAGGRRFYRPEDVALLRAIKSLLYGQGYTIKGVQRMLQEQGPRSLARVGVVSAGPSAAQPAVLQDGGMALRDQESGPSHAPPPPQLSLIPAISRVPASTQPPLERPPEIVTRLQAVAFDLAESTRLLLATRSTED